MTNKIENEHSNTPPQLFVSTVIDLLVGLLGDLVTIGIELDWRQRFGEYVSGISVTLDPYDVIL